MKIIHYIGGPKNGQKDAVPVEPSWQFEVDGFSYSLFEGKTSPETETLYAFPSDWDVSNIFRLLEMVLAFYGKAPDTCDSSST